MLETLFDDYEGDYGFAPAVQDEIRALTQQMFQT